MLPSTGHKKCYQVPAIKNATERVRILNKRRRHEKTFNLSTSDTNQISSENLLVKTHSVSRHLNCSVLELFIF